tara:strand:+ start:267 stop:599 length:333 start_codon:yes stop_codon:yes gene_type:complete
VYKEKEITVLVEHVLDYVHGKTIIHPIEKALGASDDPLDPNNKYEVFDRFIFDCHNDLKIIQKSEYNIFISEIDELRAIIQSYPNIKQSEVKKVCDEILEISPKHVLINN